MACISLQETTKGKLEMYRKSLFGIKCVFISIFVTACIGFPSADSNNSDTGTESNRQMSGGTGAASQPRTAGARTAPGPLFTGNGGKGLVIAVPAPSMSGGSQANSWMPQLFQDLITADLAKYSAMTVLDRLNESLILAEQELSASGNYSDDDYIAIGHLTNARYIVAGNILGLSGRYSITFRINNTETNEIQASFSRQYVLEDIESGLAAKEAVLALLTGMGVELTAEGERQLLTIQEREVKGQVRLAQGMAAERNNDEVYALVYSIEAVNARPGMKEASQIIQTFGQGSPGASIRERAEWATTQKARWEKIFNDLADYVNENLLLVIYDFSTISDQFDARTNRVALTVSQGVKIIPDSTVLKVWKTVIDKWEQIKKLEENKSWANSIQQYGYVPRVNSRRGGGVGIIRGIGDSDYVVVIQLYDDAGIRIAERALSINLAGIRRGGYSEENDYFMYNNNLQILPQDRYFNNVSFKSVTFNNVRISDITDNLSVKVYGILQDRDAERASRSGTLPARIMSVQEWNEWLRSQ